MGLVVIKHDLREGDSRGGAPVQLHSPSLFFSQLDGLLTDRESLPERSKEIRERLRGKGLPSGKPSRLTLTQDTNKYERRELQSADVSEYLFSRSKNSPQYSLYLESYIFRRRKLHVNAFSRFVRAFISYILIFRVSQALKVDERQHIAREEAHIWFRKIWANLPSGFWANSSVFPGHRRERRAQTWL